MDRSVGVETNKEFTTDNAPNTDRRFDGNTTANVIYVGTASERGAGTSEDKWQIKRITETAEGSVIQYADGGEFSQVWDDRASITFPTGDPTASAESETLQFVEVVGTTIISRPAVAGNDIEAYNLRNMVTNDAADLVQFSLDGGATFSDLARGEVHEFSPNDVKQIQIKSNNAGTNFDLFINRKK